MGAQEEYEKIKAKMEQQVKYGLPQEPSKPSKPAEPSETPSGWRETEDGIKYRTVTVSEVFDENSDLGKEKLLEKIEFEKGKATIEWAERQYGKGAQINNRYQCNADFASKFLDTQLIEFEKDGKTYYQTPRGEQVSKAEFLRVMKATGAGIKGAAGGSYRPSATYMALTGEGLEGRTDKDKARVTITQFNKVMHALSPASAGLESEYAEIEERNLQHMMEEMPEAFSITTPDGNVINVPAGASSVLLNGVEYQIDYSSPESPNIIGAPAGTTLSHLVAVGEAGKQIYVHQYQIKALDTEAQQILRTQGIEALNQYFIGKSQEEYRASVKTFLDSAGGDYEYWRLLDFDGQREYLKQIETESLKSFIESSGGSYEEYLNIVNEDARQAYLKNLETQNIVNLETFIRESRGQEGLDYYNSLGTKEEKDAYLQQLQSENQVAYNTQQQNISVIDNYVASGKITKDESGNISGFNLTKDDLKDTDLVTAISALYGSSAVSEIEGRVNAQDTLAGLPDVAVYDESGNITGYDYSKISREQATPEVVNAVKLMTPDYDTDTLGATFVDVDELNEGIRTAVDLHNTIAGGSPLDVGLFLVPSGVPTDLTAQSSVLSPYSDVIPTTKTYVIARKALPLSDYILQEASFKPSILEPKSFQRLYYPTITATEYSRALEGKGYNINWLAEKGAVVKPTISETVRLLAGVDPDMTKELATIDKAKLFGYGFVNTLAIESAIALPFVATPAATTGLGLLSMTPTALNWSRMNPTEKRNSIIMDGVFAVLIFGAPVLKAVSYIPRELRSIFGDIGSADLIRKVATLNNSLKTVEGVNKATQTKRIIEAATDLKNLLIAAKDIGVQGLDKLINQVEMIRTNPQIFRGVGNMNLSPELSNILARAETVLKQIETGTYKAVLTATEGRGVQVASREVIYEAPELTRLDDLFTDITREIRVARHGFVDEYGAEIAGGTGYRRAGSFIGEYGAEVEPMSYVKPSFAQEYGGEIGYTGYRYKSIIDSISNSAKLSTSELVNTGISTEQATKAADVAVDIALKSINTDLQRVSNILNDINTLSPNAFTFLLNNAGLSALALTIAPERIISTVRQASSDLRTQFINSTGISPTVLSKVINDYDDSKVSQVSGLAEDAVIKQVSITQEDLNEIIAVPQASPIEYQTIEEIIAQPTGEAIIGVPTGEITTPEIKPITDIPIEPTKMQEWQAPSVIEIPKIPEEIKEDIEEWGVPSTEEVSIKYRFDEIGVPDVTEISFKELTNLNRIVEKAKKDWVSFDTATYMRMMLLMMAENAANQEPVSVEDLPFEQRKYAEEELKRKAREKGRSVINIPFILPLLLLTNTNVVLDGIKTLPQNLKMSLLETLPDSPETEIIKEGVEIELSPQLIEQIEEAAKDIWEKQLEEIIKGDVITTPSQLELEIEEIIRKVEETGMPETLETEIRRILEPAKIGEEVIAIPLITPEAQPIVTPDVQEINKTLIEIMIETFTKAGIQPSIQGLTASQIQSLTEQQIQGLTQSQIQSLTQSQIQALTASQIQSLTQSQIQALTQTQIQSLTQTQIQSLTQTQIESMTETQLESLTQTQVEVMTPVQVETLTQVIEELKSVKPERTKFEPRKPFKLPVIGSNGKKLTKEQLEGAIGWKQGIMFKYIYPPYGQEDIINSRSPIQGIPVKEGIRSAYETIIRTRKGYIPPNITRHMGMMDIFITDADKNGQPEIKFVEREQRKGRGAVSKKKTNPIQVFTIE